MPIVTALLAALAVAAAEGFIYGRFWARGLGVSVAYAQSTAFEGERLSLAITIANRKPLPLPLFQLKAQVRRGLAFDGAPQTAVTDDDYISEAFNLTPYAGLTRTLGLSCPKRGYYPVKAVSCVCRNILMNRKFTAEVKTRAAVTVYPRLLDAPDIEPPLTKLMGDVAARRFAIEDPFTFKAVRPYLPGDPPKTVNWKATARAQGLMVNQADVTIDGRVALAVNFERERVWPDVDVFEETIRLAATLAERLTAAGVPVSLISNGADFATGLPAQLPFGAGGGQLEALWETLARLDYSAEPEAMAGRLAEAAGGDVIVALISNYAGPDLREAFAALKDGIWLRPMKPDPGRLPEEELPGAWVWEVN